MDRVPLALLNTNADGEDVLETPLGTAHWWTALGITLSGRPRFDAALSASLRAIREALLARLAEQTAPLPATFRGDDSDGILFEVLHSARAALAADWARRVRRCRLQACGRYFCDETKNGSKRWCSLRCMERARVPRRRTIGR
jgi:predicted RNA-binding Zn ribbon-like protein